MCAGTLRVWSRSPIRRLCGKSWNIRYRRSSVGRELSVTTRAQVLSSARAWLRRALPAGWAALALLGIGAGALVAATGTAQPDAGPAAGASLLDISAGRMLPAPVASSAPQPGSGPQTARLAPLGKLLTADVLVVSSTSLPAGSDAAVRRVHGVVAAGLVDAARVQVNGKYVAM